MRLRALAPAPAALMLALLTACGRAPAPALATPAGPAMRIVTLAPHLAELVHSAGAGDRLAGVVAFSDFPPGVRALPQVGDAFRVDYEALAALAPDLVLAWSSGNPPEVIERLERLGIRVVALEPVELADVARHIERIGDLAGTGATAAAAAADFRARLAALGERYSAAAPLRVFVQLQPRPYITVTDRHFIGQGLRLCGGVNVFGALPGLTATIGAESVLEARPEAIIASDMGGEGDATAAGWQSWPEIPAVKSGAIYAIDADLLSRPSARILDGIERLCDRLDAARRRLAAVRRG